MASIAKLPAPHASATKFGLVLPAGRPPEVIAFEAEMVDFFVSAADLLGVPRSVAAIYGIVFASPEPLSFGDVEARLNISKGSISQGLRVLREVGALKEVSAPSARAEIFVPNLEMRKLVGHFIENRLEKQLAEGRSRLVSLERRIPSRGASGASLRKRLISLSDWHTKARGLLPIVRGILKVSG